MPCRIIIAFLACLTLAAPSGVLSRVLAEEQTLKITDCVLQLIEEAQVPAREPGVIKSIEVIEGASVSPGSLLASLDDEAAQANLKIADADYQAALAQATSDVKLQLARAEAEILETEFLRGQGSATDDEEKKQLRRLLLAPRRVKLQSSVAELEQQIAKLTSQVKAAQVRAAKVQLDRRRIVSPLNGVVVQVYQHAGEWARPGEPILHVVRMDRLRVVGFVNAEDAAPEELLGRPVLIEVYDRRGLKREVRSKIAFASPIVETSGQYRIWTEVENKQMKNVWLLRPGLTADMKIQLQ